MAYNGIDIHKRFTARWVNYIDGNNNIVVASKIYGTDLTVNYWQALVTLAKDVLQPGWKIEFQTYNVDEVGDSVGEINDYAIDFVEGQARLMMVLETV